MRRVAVGIYLNGQSVPGSFTCKDMGCGCAKAEIPSYIISDSASVVQSYSPPRPIDRPREGLPGARSPHNPSPLFYTEKGGATEMECAASMRVRSVRKGGDWSACTSSSQVKYGFSWLQPSSIVLMPNLHSQYLQR